MIAVDPPDAGTCTTPLCATGEANRSNVICDNSLPWRPCGTDQPDDYKLTCAEIEDQHCSGVDRSTYQYACCPCHSHPDTDCAQGLCAGGVVDRDAIICDNREAGSPCGSDLHAELVLTCGDIHDQITWGFKTPCAQAASEYSAAYPQCCGADGGISEGRYINLLLCPRDIPLCRESACTGSALCLCVLCSARATLVVSGSSLLCMPLSPETESAPVYADQAFLLPSSLLSFMRVTSTANALSLWI